MTARFMHSMLWVTAIVWLAGCATGAGVGTKNFTTPGISAGTSTTAEDTSAQETPANVEPSTAGADEAKQAQTEMQAAADDRAAPSTQPSSAAARPHLPRVDPGASALIDRMLVADAQRPRDADGWTQIALESLTNYSRATRDEFDAFKKRLADLLSRAGRDDKVRFTAEPAPDAPVHRRLTGTAYLVTAGGFDQWELYLTLMPADEAWTVWRSDGPVRVLRAAPAHGQQVFIPSKTPP